MDLKGALVLFKKKKKKTCWPWHNLDIGSRWLEWGKTSLCEWDYGLAAYWSTIFSSYAKLCQHLTISEMHHPPWSLLLALFYFSNYLCFCLHPALSFIFSNVIFMCFQEETVEELSGNASDDLIISLYQMDLDRTLFLLRSYLRVRLQKVSSTVLFIVFRPQSYLGFSVTWLDSADWEVYAPYFKNTTLEPAIWTRTKVCRKVRVSNYWRKIC